ncbi:MAG: hypothetical protein ACRD03_00795 [Acidimicrobiales bacterium]
MPELRKHPQTVEALLAHCQHLPGRPGVEVAPAPIDPRQAKVALSMLVRAGLAELLAGEIDVDVLVDVGRLENDGRSDHFCLDLAAYGSSVVFWSHDDPDGRDHCRTSSRRRSERRRSACSHRAGTP